MGQKKMSGRKLIALRIITSVIEYPYFSCKSDQFQLRTPSNHQLLLLVHTPVTGHERACSRDRTDPGNR